MVIRTGIQDPTIDTLVRSAFGIGPDDQVSTDLLYTISAIYISGNSDGTYHLSLNTHTGSFDTSITVDAFDSLSLVDAAAFERLRTLSIENCHVIESYDALAYLPAELSVLQLNNCSVIGDNKELPSLSHLENLTNIDFIELEITQLPTITSIASQTKVTIRNCPISNLMPLENISSLVSIALVNTQVSDLQALIQHTALTSVIIENCLVTDPYPLTLLPNIQTISLISNPISDYSSLDALGDEVRITIQ